MFKAALHVTTQSIVTDKATPEYKLFMLDQDGDDQDAHSLSEDAALKLYDALATVLRKPLQERRQAELASANKRRQEANQAW